MKRLYEAQAYGPQTGCYWSETVNPVPTNPLQQDLRVTALVIGAGFTGLNAALALAKRGIDVAVLDAQTPGWGASGRNGGFCCLGGAKSSPAALSRAFGADAPRLWAQTEIAAVDHVEGLITDHGLQVDRQSQGETLLAHSKRAWRGMQSEAHELTASYGRAPQLMDVPDLRAQGLNGPWYGGWTLPFGFALNPRKYHSGLRTLALDAGVRIHDQTPVTALKQRGPDWEMTTPQGQVRADMVLLATNGYSSDDLPPWLSARYLPVLSNIIVTAPLSDADQKAQGWWSDQMAYDSRYLLHYFRLMPNGRFLFGMRGGLRSSPRQDRIRKQQIRRHFHAMFPGWRHVEITHDWSGLACLMPNLVPFCGPVPDQPGLFAAMGFHGNGVAMGSYAGYLIAHDMVGARAPGPYPDLMRKPPKRFPLGMRRRALLGPAYLAASLLDR